MRIVFISEFMRAIAQADNSRKGIVMVDYSSISDEQLVSLCRKNNAEAWSELYSRYIAVTRSISLKFNKYNIETDDLIQEGLLGFLSAVHSFEANGSAGFRTYAGICIHNRIVNAVKALKTKRQIPYDLQFSLDNDEVITDTAMSPEEFVISQHEANQIMSAIYEKLSDRESDVFRLYLSGNTYEEIAQKLAMSPKAVDGAIQRARKKLRMRFN